MSKKEIVEEAVVPKTITVAIEVPEGSFPIDTPPEFLTLPGKMNDKNYIFCFEDGTPFNDIKQILSLYRDHIVLRQLDAEKIEAAKEKKPLDAELVS